VDHETQRYLQLVNDVKVSPEQLAESLQSSIAPSTSVFGQLTMTKVSFVVTETAKAPTPELACRMRLLALFALIGREENIGWTWAPVIPFSSQDPVLKAAAMISLVSREGRNLIPAGRFRHRSRTNPIDAQLSGCTGREPLLYCVPRATGSTRGSRR
jgi:hypothetical protein